MSEEKKSKMPDVIARKIQWPSNPAAMQHLHNNKNGKFNSMGKNPGVKRAVRGAAKGR